MKNIYRNKQLAGWRSLIRLARNEVIRRGEYSLFQYPDRVVIRKGRKTIAKADNLDDGFNLLIKIAKERDNGRQQR